jgi:hypothetical protein
VTGDLVTRLYRDVGVGIRRARFTVQRLMVIVAIITFAIGCCIWAFRPPSVRRDSTHREK